MVRVSLSGSLCGFLLFAVSGYGEGYVRVAVLLGAVPECEGRFLVRGV